mmetsp:Transcript_19258/g.33323  ORF Transcript_19258/g.33323 Transcript_19258/m.33323 type:complete len:224 (-) Transcript_19258:446-1117(-)
MLRAKRRRRSQRIVINRLGECEHCGVRVTQLVLYVYVRDTPVVVRNAHALELAVWIVHQPAALEVVQQLGVDVHQRLGARDLHLKRSQGTIVAQSFGTRESLQLSLVVILLVAAGPAHWQRIRGVHRVQRPRWVGWQRLAVVVGAGAHPHGAVSRSDASTTGHTLARLVFFLRAGHRVDRIVLAGGVEEVLRRVGVLPTGGAQLVQQFHVGVDQRTSLSRPVD